MTVEPASSSYGLAKAAFGTGTAVIHLTDTVLGRITAKRDLRKQEERALRIMLEARVRDVHADEQARLTESATARIVRLAEVYDAAASRSSTAADAAARAFVIGVDSILRSSVMPDVTRF